MALGSLAPATKVSPMPSARAPTPMRRNVPDDVPARCSPSELCAMAGEAAPISAAAVAAKRPARRKRSEIDIELRSPLGAGAVVRRVIDSANANELVQAVDVVGIEAAFAPDVALAGDRIDAIDEVVVEDVRALQAQVEAAAHHLEPAVHLDVGGDLERSVHRVGQPDRILVGE